jgi:hypothetical protein
MRSRHLDVVYGNKASFSAVLALHQQPVVLRVESKEDFVFLDRYLPCSCGIIIIKGLDNSSMFSLDSTK